MQKLLVLLLFLISGVGCADKPEDLIEKARIELEKENRDGALELLRQAFELSLGEDFHFRPVHEKFSQLYVSRSGNRVLLVPLEKPKSFQLFDETGKLLRKGTAPSKIVRAGISPTGNFLIFLTHNGDDGNCLLSVYDSQQAKFTSKAANAVCEMTPAISDAASFPLVSDGKIFLHTTGGVVELKQKPDKPIAKMPAYPAFYYNKDNQLFFTYGSAGVYKFYHIDSKANLKLIHKDITTGKITFNSAGLEPGVIIGGAGSMKMYFFNPQTLQPTGKTWNTSAWNELVILDDRSRFYTENAALFEYRSGKDKELPFWATQLHALSGGRLLFISSTGAATVYSGIEPSASSIAIYKKGAELDERK